MDFNATKLYYKLSSESNYKTVAFQQTAYEHQFTAVIKDNGYKSGDIIEYYLEARDLAKVPNIARYPQSGVMSFSIVDKNILLVDDDFGSDLEELYKSILLDNGYAFDYYDLNQIGNITGEKLMGYTAVIWFCSNAMYETVTQSDAEAISYYLNRGGNMLLSGNHIAYEANSIGWNGKDDDGSDDDNIIPPRILDTLSDTSSQIEDDKDNVPDQDSDTRPEPSPEPSPEPKPEPNPDGTGTTSSFSEWLEEYFKVMYLDFGYDTEIVGVSDNPISDGLEFNLGSRKGEVFEYSGMTDVLEYNDPGEMIFSMKGKSRGSATGVMFDGNHQTIFLSFDINDIQNKSTSDSVLSRCVDWLYLGDNNIQNLPPILLVDKNGRTEMGKNRFNFTVVYKDSENDLPYGVYCVINGVEYTMAPLDISDSDYTDGKIYFIELEFEDGEYKYYFKTVGANNTKEFTLKIGETTSTYLNSTMFIGVIIVIVIIILISLGIMKSQQSRKIPSTHEMKNKDRIKSRNKKSAEVKLHKNATKVMKVKTKKRSAVKDKKIKSKITDTTETTEKSSFCPSCKKSIPLDVDQCPYCSEQLAEGLECPKCNNPISENDKRCPHCGVRFG